MPGVRFFKILLKDPVTITITYKTAVFSIDSIDKCFIAQNLGASTQPTSITDMNSSSLGWYWQFNRKQGFKIDGSTRTPNTPWISDITENSEWLPSNDPCALLLGEGWHITTSWQHPDISSNWENIYDAFNSPLKIHAAGLLNNSSGNPSMQGKWGVFWQKGQYGSQGFLFYFLLDSYFVGSGIKSNGVSLRCMKD